MRGADGRSREGVSEVRIWENHRGQRSNRLEVETPTAWFSVEPGRKT
jgi:hypothetical protein